MRNSALKPLLYLTIAWFGIEMAMALDATQFQILLDHHLQQFAHPFFLKLHFWGNHIRFPVGKAFLIALVLSLGPIAGITVQPLMGRLGDVLQKRGIGRRLVMRITVMFALGCALLFALQLELWELIVAIALFFIAFNALIVNYRALVTETSNRKGLASHKGMVSGLVAMFSGVGGFCMFMLFKVFGNSFWPPLCSAAILAITSWLMFQYAPIPRSEKRIRASASKFSAVSVGESDSHPLSEAELAEQVQKLSTLWHWAFYVFPFINMIPSIEKKLSNTESQKTTFRLFLVVFFFWLGIQALRAFFVLLATKEMGLSYQNANLAMAVLTIVTVGAALPIGQLADRYDSRKLLLYSLAGFSVVTSLAFFMAHTFPAVLVMSVLLGVVFAGMVVLPLSMLFKLCPKRSEGTYSGLYNLFMSVPQLYSLFLTGWLVDIFHSYRVILLVAALAGLGGALLVKRLPEQSPETDPAKQGMAFIH